jgi:hypothetical protein
MMMQITRKDIASKAFEMFREWTTGARFYFPTLDFTIIDESVLVQDLVKSIQSARKALLDEKHDAKRVKLGYDVGFMLGFIGGQLDAHWTHEYITKQSREYKEFTALSAVRQYFFVNEIAAIHTIELYKHLLTRNANLDNLSTQISVRSLEELSEIDIAPASQNPVLLAIDSLINAYILKNYRNGSADLMRPMHCYFSNEEMEFLIHNPLE